MKLRRSDAGRSGIECGFSGGLGYWPRSRSKGEEVEKLNAVSAQAEMIALSGHDTTAWIFGVFLFVDGEQVVTLVRGQFGVGAWKDSDGDTGVVEVDFVAGDVGRGDVGSRLDEWGVAPEKIEVGHPDQLEERPEPFRVGPAGEPLAYSTSRPSL